MKFLFALVLSALFFNSCASAPRLTEEDELVPVPNQSSEEAPPPATGEQSSEEIEEF